MDRRLLLNFAWSAPLAAGVGGLPSVAAGAEGRSAPPPRRSGPGVIVLDPGHGGADPGAIGLHGTREKDVTLDITRELARLLAGQHKVKTVLTREDDRFLALGDRVAAARAARADLFVSVHADSAPNKDARGLSAYTVSDKASDAFAGALAQRENKADALGGVDLNGANRVVKAILFDLATRHTKRAALVARQSIVRGAGRELKLLDNPMRAADFAVLKAPDVPSVLIETGFLSNPADEESLRSADARRAIARVLARELAAVLGRPPFA